jgi:hypothetical protein
MWSRPGGTRILIADGVAGGFIRRHYRFDEVRHAPVDVQWSRLVTGTGDRLSVRAGDLSLELEIGPRSALSVLLRLRPRRLGAMRGWMAVEDLLLRPLAAPLIGGSGGVRVRGRTAEGAREWYVLEDHRPVVAGSGCADGEHWGDVAAVDRRLGFGFSEFPARPAVVSVTSLFEAGTGTDVPSADRRSGFGGTGGPGSG